jgi:hypothetical protein
VAVKSVPEPLRIDDLSAVDVYDNQLCIWRRGIDEAVVRLPVKSRNVHLLQSLLSERIAQSQEAAGTAAGDGLGRVLFERKAGRLLTTVLWLGVPLLLVPGLVCFLNPNSWIVGICLVAGSLGLALGGVACQFNRFRCHERGVYKRGLFGTRQLKYDDVAAFTYSATRHYHNGAYVGTQLVMRFDPRPEALAKTISYQASVSAADEALDSLRDHVSRVLAARMAGELAGGGSVVWTTNLGFSPEGIVYRPSGFLGRKEPLLLPYDRFSHFDFQQGTFRLYAKDNPKPLTTEASSQKNFYPGYFVLLGMFYNREG